MVVVLVTDTSVAAEVSVAVVVSEAVAALVRRT